MQNMIRRFCKKRVLFYSVKMLCDMSYLDINDQDSKNGGGLAKG